MIYLTNTFCVLGHLIKIHYFQITPVYLHRFIQRSHLISSLHRLNTPRASNSLPKTLLRERPTSQAEVYVKTDPFLSPILLQNSLRRFFSVNKYPNLFTNICPFLHCVIGRQFHFL